MLTEEIRQAILNGEPAITKGGHKAQYFGEDYLDNEDPYGFVVFPENGAERAFISWHHADLTSDFPENDIIGLWKDKPEPFDCSRALAGEPVLLRNQLKGYILKQIDDTLIGYFDHSSPISWGLDGSRSQTADSSFDIIGMWKEPENAQANAQAQYKELPKPITEFGDLEKAWFVGSMPSCLFPAYYSSKNFNDLDVKLRLQNKQLFATEEHAQLWCDALSGKLKVAIVD
ncbi:hypothetical protein [Rodentibacter caecimuris]|uniref:hypothetical protein n=1 Tax=Rodentibacter caecimuris TaxID=1796644 RepID=UPI00211A2DF2|nr:hypothetical protein [Rodentibacter heylii]MCQ9124326.1 hypothetical protein [Rodentibacter heylii]